MQRCAPDSHPPPCRQQAVAARCSQQPVCRSQQPARQARWQRQLGRLTLLLWRQLAVMVASSRWPVLRAPHGRQPMPLEFRCRQLTVATPLAQRCPAPSAKDGGIKQARQVHACAVADARARARPPSGPAVAPAPGSMVPPGELKLLTHPAPCHVYIHTACLTQNPTTNSCACERGCPLPTSSRLLMSGCQKERVPRLTCSLPPPSCTTNLLVNLSTPPCLPAFILACFHHFFITLAVHICPGPHPRFLVLSPLLAKPLFAHLLLPYLPCFFEPPFERNPPPWWWNCTATASAPASAQ